MEKHTRHNTYECFYPGPRFMGIANKILERDGSLNERNILSACWSNNEGYDEYWLHKYQQQRSQETRVYFTLTHADQRFTSPNMTRYAVICIDGECSDIFLLNEQKLIVPLDQQSKNDAAHRALAALTENVPDIARGVQDYYFDKSFNHAAAIFVLSDFAVRDREQEMSDESVLRAITRHYTWTVDIMHDGIANANDLPHREDTSHPNHREKVRNAARIDPATTRSNRFAHISLRAITHELAKSMNYEWQHEVNLNTDSYKEKRGDS